MKEKNKDKSKKNKRKHSKKILRVLVYIVLIAFVLSFVFLIGFGIYHLCTSSKYVVKKVEFKGNVIYDIETLTATANVPMGENLYRFSKKTIKNNLDTLSYIDKIKINRKLPDTVQITLKEYVSKYMAYNIEEDIYIRLSEDGVILERVEGEQKQETELLLFGISFDDNAKEKSIIAETEIKKIEKYEIVKKVYEKSSIEKEITSVEFKENNVILTLDYDINVILNMDNLDYNISFLASILERISGKAGTIDMTKTNPVFTESIR